jgi:hypothetical protein
VDLLVAFAVKMKTVQDAEMMAARTKNGAKISIVVRIEG